MPSGCAKFPLLVRELFVKALIAALRDLL